MSTVKAYLERVCVHSDILKEDIFGHCHFKIKVSDTNIYDDYFKCFIDFFEKNPTLVPENVSVMDYALITFNNFTAKPKLVGGIEVAYVYAAIVSKTKVVDEKGNTIEADIIDDLSYTDVEVELSVGEVYTTIGYRVCFIVDKLIVKS